MADRTPYIALRCGDATSDEQTLAADEIERLRTALTMIRHNFMGTGAAEVAKIALTTES